MIKLVITFYLSIYLFISQPQTPDRDHPRKQVKEPRAIDDDLERKVPYPTGIPTSHATGARERGFSLLDSFSSRSFLHSRSRFVLTFRLSISILPHPPNNFSGLGTNGDTARVSVRSLQ
ncbi:hypothetical protein BO86DRAFT_106148 [Aspergillus japonicus CBS 114.51]|uniref:Uncharacterized protein n=1 Tax=Aspergillus japonicus CBS 114.51 TaxID=1448312 RepID=A0A8T8WZ20_ASPJA|nr:hypothetical protein BO86DRAFT_106148 [Aspergillus japonicus CBS 114.51]RAH81065.1 hypothetical protein BO86DRAFT_106148 [Aspergillus japonicus CBS 114.51]